jgi:hypothetical protein
LASASFFTRTPGKVFFVIDHSVGRTGRNLRDDVQLIQILLNRYFVSAKHFADYEESQPPSSDPNLARFFRDQVPVDAKGRRIESIRVDGICGPETLGAILAFQQAKKRVVGMAPQVDGLVNAVGIAGQDTFVDPHRYLKLRTMWLLCGTTSSGPPPLGIDEIDVEPLRSVLLKSLKSQGL